VPTAVLLEVARDAFWAQSSIALDVENAGLSLGKDQSGTQR
jgi:hypothetical protein